MSKTNEAKEKKQRDEDYDRAQRFFVWNSSGLALRLFIRPVYPNDKAWAADVLAVRKEPLLLSPWISPHEVQEAEDLLRKYGVERDSLE